MGIGLYALKSLMTLALYLRHRNSPEPVPQDPQVWPIVTVQLPVYNEPHTIERLLAAVAALDYPRDRLEVQVLDDSTDDTPDLITRRVRTLREQGVAVSHLRRSNRKGFKAGALAAGLVEAEGSLVAIFDADFVPEPGILRKMVPFFCEPNVGCVQARWGHLNRCESLFTRAQALGLDSHYIIEKTARSRAGLFDCFSGSGGIWRRACIDDSGGWSADTLTEDLDLSYRARIRGWRIVYLPDVVVPAELPVAVGALKRQQARWSEGTTRAAVKLAVPLLRSHHPWRVKLDALWPRFGYAAHPLLLAVALLTIPMARSHDWVRLVGPFLPLLGAGPPVSLLVLAQAVQGRRWYQIVPDLVWLILMVIGLGLNDALAALQAVFGPGREFQRTPKHGKQTDPHSSGNHGFAPSADPSAWVELVLAIGFLLAFLLARERTVATYWLLMYTCGFGFVGGASLYQSTFRPLWHRKRAQTAPARVVEALRGHISSPFGRPPQQHKRDRRGV